MNIFKKIKKMLSLTLITGIILSLLSFGSVTASASCPLTSMLFGGFGGFGNSGLGNSGGLGGFGGLGSLFGNFGGGNFGNSGNLFGNNFINPGNGSGSCFTPPAVNNRPPAVNCNPPASNNNCVGNVCLTNCSTCTNCSDCPDCPQCEFDSPAKKAFELDKGFTYAIRINMNGAGNLTVNSSAPEIASAQLRGTNRNGQTVIHVKALNAGNVKINICPVNSTAACEVVYITVTDKNANTSGNQNNSSSAKGCSVFAEEVLQYVNEARARNNLSALVLDNTLCAAAEVRAEEVGRRFSHTRPDGSSWITVIREFGIPYRVCGENIALGYRDARTVVNGWLNSPSHRANIMSPNYTRMGVGRVGNGWAQLFTG